MTWYVMAATWFVAAAAVGLIVSEILIRLHERYEPPAGRVSPSGSPHVPSCCPPEGENTP